MKSLTLPRGPNESPRVALLQGPAMLPKSREILKLKLQGQQPPAGEPSGTSVGASEISTALLRDESRVEQVSLKSFEYAYSKLP